MLDQTTMDDLARCHANAMDCDALCEQIYYSQHGQLPASFKACELVVDPATGAQSVHYIAFVHSCTGRRPANYRPVFHKQEVVKVPYPPGGRKY